MFKLQPEFIAFFMVQNNISLLMKHLHNLTLHLFYVHASVPLTNKSEGLSARITNPQNLKSIIKTKSKTAVTCIVPDLVLGPSAVLRAIYF